MLTILFLMGGFAGLLAITEVLAKAILRNTKYAELFTEENEEW